MKKVITVSYDDKISSLQDPNRKIVVREVLDTLATAYVQNGNHADIGVVDSRDFSYLYLSGGHSYVSILEDALQKLGATDVKVTGSSYETGSLGIEQMLKNSMPDEQFEFLNLQRELWRSNAAVVYRFEAKKEEK